MGAEIDERVRALDAGKGGVGLRIRWGDEGDTVRLCDGSDETSRTTTPGTAAMASRICRTTSGRRPSEKLGTHSIKGMELRGAGVWGQETTTSGA